MVKQIHQVQSFTCVRTNTEIVNEVLYRQTDSRGVKQMPSKYNSKHNLLLDIFIEIQVYSIFFWFLLCFAPPTTIYC